MPEQRWNIPGTVRRKIADTMERTLFGDRESQRDVTGQIEQVGKRELAMRMAGTRDTRSRAYKSARDSLTRWGRGARSPSGKSLDRVAGAGRSFRADQFRDTGRLSVAMIGTFQTSRTDWQGAARAELTGGALDMFLGAVERGDAEMAARTVARAYGPDFADYVTGIKDVKEFRLRDGGTQ